MTLNEIANFACDKIGANDDESIALCKRFIENRYKVIWDKYLWRETVEVYSPDYLTAGQQEVILYEAGHIARVLQVCRNDSETFGPIEWNSLWLTNPAALSSSSGITRGFTLKRNSASRIAPDTLESQVLRVSNGGEGNFVTISGIASSINDDYQPMTWTHEVAAGTTTTFGSVVKFREIWSFTRESKETLDDMVLETSAGSLIAFLMGGQLAAPTFPAFRLWEPLVTGDSLRIIGKLRCPGFSGLYDTSTSEPIPQVVDGSPMIQGIDEALIAFAQADMLQRQRQYGKAAILNQEGAGHVQNLIQRQVDQTASDIRIIPVIEPDPLGWNRHPEKSYF